MIDPRFCIRFVSSVLLFAILTLSHDLRAQGKASNNPLTPIANHLDASDMLVGWFDVQAASPEAIEAVLSFVRGQPSTADDLSFLRTLHQTLTTHGVQRAYVALDPLTGHGGPLFLFPADDANGLNDALWKLAAGSGNVTRVDQSVVLLGDKDRLNRAAKRPHAASATLMDAAENVEGPHGMVFSPNTVLREGIAAWSVVVGEGERDVQAVVESLAGLRAVTGSFQVPLDRVRLDATFESAEQAQKLLPVWRDKLQSMLGDASLVDQLKRKDRQLILETQSPEQSSVAFSFIVGSFLGPRQVSAETNNLKQIGLALQSFESVHGQFPPQSLVDANGRKLLSWRVLILPYLGKDGESLYKEFRLNEPWDSDHNRALLDKMPLVFGRQGTRTVFQAPLTSDSVFGHLGLPAKISDITDGTSKTLWLVRMPDSDAIEWTRPEDWVVPAQDPLALFRAAGKSFLGARADGSVQPFKSSMDEKTFRALISRDGGELIEEDVRE